jgi:cellulose biosynthesis protein BcsQ
MGDIVTFYSYKGGTGRSMSLANVAWILASNDKRVLVIDWDLEAPGLHRYFRPFLLDKDLTAPSSRGLADFVRDFAIEAATPHEQSQRTAEWYAERANILRYATSLDWRFGPRGSIDFVPPGRQGPDYGAFVSSFNWVNFYERLGGGTFLRAARERMKELYDYVLIDSRTGVSDTSGICTVVLPDVLVVYFTLNNQSIDGGLGIAQSAVAQALQEPGRQPVRVLPVPSRTDPFEKRKLERRRRYAHEQFAHFVSDPTHWRDVEVPYVPYYSYEETLSTFEDEPGGLATVLGACERLTARITKGVVTGLKPPTEEERAAVRAAFEQVSRAEPAAAASGGAARFAVARALAAAAVFLYVVIVVIWDGSRLFQAARSSRAAAVVARAQQANNALLAALLLGELSGQAEPPGGMAFVRETAAAGVPRFFLTEAAQVAVMSEDGRHLFTARDVVGPGGDNQSDAALWRIADGRLVNAFRMPGLVIGVDEAVTRALQLTVIPLGGVAPRAALERAAALQLVDLTNGTAGQPKQVPAVATLLSGWVPLRPPAPAEPSLMLTSGGLVQIALDANAADHLTLAPPIDLMQFIDDASHVAIAPDQRAFLTCAALECQLREVTSRGVSTRWKVQAAERVTSAAVQRQLVVIGFGSGVHVYDRASGTMRNRLAMEGDVGVLALSDDEGTMAVGTNLGIHVVDVAPASVARTLPLPAQSPISVLKLSGNGQLLMALASGGLGLAVWDLSARLTAESWSEAVQQLRAMTSSCLSAEDRQVALRESLEQALARYRSCQAAFGRPTRVFDLPLQPATAWTVDKERVDARCGATALPPAQARDASAANGIEVAIGGCTHLVRGFQVPEASTASSELEIEAGVSIPEGVDASAALQVELVRGREGVVGSIWFSPGASREPLARPPSKRSDAGVDAPVRQVPPPAGVEPCVPNRAGRLFHDGEFKLPLTALGAERRFTEVRLHLYASACVDPARASLALRRVRLNH